MPIDRPEDLQVYAPPRSLPTEEMDDELPDPDEPGLIGAEFWPRAAARAIDWVYLGIVYSIGGFMGGIVLTVLDASGAIPPGWTQRVGQGGIAAMGIGTIATIAYHTLSESVHGASFGKLCMKLRVVTTEGRRAGLVAGLVRSAAFLIDSFFFGMVAASAMGNSPRNQRYGDQWAHTLVVRVADLPLAHRPSLGRFLVALALGSAAAGAINTGYLMYSGIG